MFSENLVYYRKKKGLTQKDLAEIIFVSRSAIALYEKGIRFPNKDIIDSICSTLDVSYNELVYGDYENTNSKVPLKFRKLRQGDVIKAYCVGKFNIYVINRIHNDYLEAFSINSYNDIYYNNIMYKSISNFDLCGEYPKCLVNFLKFNLDEIYQKLHLDYDIYKLNKCLSSFSMYVGSFKDEEIKIKSHLLPKGMYKVFLEEGYFKHKKSTISYTFSGKEINLLNEEPAKIDILLDSDEPLYHIVEVIEDAVINRFYKIARRINENKCIFYTFTENEGVIFKKDDISKYEKVYLIPRSFKERENEINLDISYEELVEEI